MNPNIDAQDNRQKLNCPQCGSPAKVRAKPQPLVATLSFGLSALIFLFWGSQRAGPIGTWVWSGCQILLGAWVVIGRIRARSPDLVCIPCGEKLRFKD